MTASIDHYKYHVTWSEEDKAYIGHCLEFPSVSWVGGSKEGALEGIRAVIFDYIQFLRENEEEKSSPKAPKTDTEFFP